ncbi:hypothetical protein LXL04_017524 [Taraxacum kok-saghyz]
MEMNRRVCTSSGGDDGTVGVSPLSTSPSAISCCKSFGSFPSTVQPTEIHVPRSSFTVPANSLAIDLGLITLAISITSSNDMFLECLMFFTFFLSRSGSFRALITRAAADGTTETLACRFWTVSLTVTRNPFQSLAVSLAMSSPIFFATMSGDGSSNTDLSIQNANLIKNGLNSQPQNPKLSDNLQINLKLNSQDYALWT